MENIQNFLANSGISLLNTIYEKLEIHDKISSLLDFISSVDDYSQTFSYFVGGVYFIFGKPLVIALISVIAVIIGIRLCMAIVNLIYP